MRKYTTKAGDTFDKLALEFYYDEYKAYILRQANLDYLSTIVFPSGVTLNIPIIEQEAENTLPPWKR